ncbi:M3 family oligoendopeptidase [Sphingobacterium sp. SGG-5]|uniref:M3 family oligoendopeptidase n=1 Tax=Sphingobacterium sp. SGG-5 TaxID=2710881 RepID=UPI0013E9FF3D|nr:M3 family oligoendopeptidase [Sphingobacterium sp. SGG-5]NGM62201.1 M3 family oligoendopeptidase [Sphingobacterium sp. SGG-5]
MKTPLAKPRKFVPENLEIRWEALAPLFSELKNQPLQSLQDLEQWLQYRSELDAVLSEDYAWRYIKMTCNTTDQKLAEDFQYFATEIEPKMASVTNELDKKLAACPYTDQLTGDGYRIYLRKVKKSLEIFREENIPLFTEVQLKQQEYQTIVGGLSVEIDGKTMTLQQASTRLLENDREQREQAWRLINHERLAKKEQLDTLFNELVNLRHQIARNAGFENFRDYMFAAMGRFDYTVEDCENFHHTIRDVVVPILQEFTREREDKLNVGTLKPWDMSVDPENRPPLKPFSSGEELIRKTEEAFNHIHPYIGQCIRTMRENKLFDVESRLGKAPGGYNYPLYESGAPFIFMNAAGTLRDLTTMVHEGGHAVHTFISADLALTAFKDLPSEVAELASMSMELISMDQWHLFLNDSTELARAKREQLEDALSTLPWVATIDAFQHWIYTHPEHTTEERKEAWLAIYNEFGRGFTNWETLEEAEMYLWHKQLHIFEVPFYYIEYGFAQLGAIAVWKNYLENKKEGIEKYLGALKLGYTQSIPEIYAAAGVEFDFSEEYVRGLTDFLRKEVKKA